MQHRKLAILQHADVPYSLVVSLEALETNIPIYNLVKTKVETEISEVETEISEKITI